MKGAARHTFGLVLLVISVLTWTLGTFLNASIFADSSFAKPFFITYFNTSTFVLMLIPILVKSAYKEHRNGTLKSTVQSLFSRRTLHVLFSNDSKVEALYQAERQPLLQPGGKSAILPTYAAIDNNHTLSTSENDAEYLDLLPTARLAITFSLFWFGANYFTSASLSYTTPASATILGSTQSLWALAVGALTHFEIFTWRKLCGVVATVTGVILITSADIFAPPANESSKPPASGLVDKSMSLIALGDLLALCGAAFYGIYALMMKRADLKAYPRRLHMPTFFGFVGVINCLLTAPLFPILHYTGIEVFQWPPMGRVLTVVLSYATSSLITDLLMAYVTVLTSPLVMTVGLSLNIPVALMGEMFWLHQYKGWLYWVGAAIVVGSFVFVDRQEAHDEETVRDDYISRSMENSRVLGRAGDDAVSSKTVTIAGFRGGYDASSDDERYAGEKRRNGKRREKDDGDDDDDDEEQIDDIAYGSVIDININDISSSGPSSYDRRSTSLGYR